MDTLDNTDWDVLLVGTGLQQSLLALALSRSDKKILHIDQNDYYGGAEAAFSLQEVEQWARRINGDSEQAVDAGAAAFSTVAVTNFDVSGPDSSRPKLSSSRAYSLALSPQLIYARSTLLQYLVSSRVYRQLEFLAVGSWWVYSIDNGIEISSVLDGKPPNGKLLKVPNGREDVFQDHELDFKAKRALMKFLRFIGDYEEQVEIWEPYRYRPFTAFLSEHFKVPPILQGPILALTLSSAPSEQNNTEYALPRIARHLRSIGVFGAGFGAVIPKWGGLAEISQVSCRACAVGGGVYVLGSGLSASQNKIVQTSDSGTKLRLKDGEVVTAKWIVGGSTSSVPEDSCCRSISIVSSPLTPLFPPIAEEAPAPASAMVVFPTGSLFLDVQSEQLPPVHISVHSSDTGECPAGQSVCYASTALSGERGFDLLKKAVKALLALTDVSPNAMLLWSAQYQQQPTSGEERLPAEPNGHVIRFPPASLDLAFDDTLFDNVKDAWRQIVDDTEAEFLVFQDREAYDDDE